MAGNRYLLVTWDGGGVLPPELGVARRLIARGHSVRVLADPTAAAEALAAGCGFTPWTTAPHITVRGEQGAIIRDWESANPVRMLHDYMDSFLAGPTPRWLADIEAELDARPVDGLLVDFAIPAAGIAAEARGLPFVTLMPNCWIVPTKGIPPMGPGWQPATNPLSRAREVAARAVMRRMFDRALPPLNAARAERGLAPRASALDLMAGANTLVLTSPAFDFGSPAIPASVHYAGPVLDDPSWAQPWSPPWPADDTRPLVLVGLSSTFQNQVGVLDSVVAGLATLPVRALVTLGPALDPSQVRGRSGVGDVRIVSSAPHGAVLRGTAAVVTHGGHGTLMKALAAGVPVVVLPMGRDQNDSAARVVHRGAGIRLKPTAKPAAVAAAVRTVLAEPGYAAGARRIATAVEAGTGCVDVVEAIEAVTARRPIGAVTR